MPIHHRKMDHPLSRRRTFNSPSPSILTLASILGGLQGGCGSDASTSATSASATSVVNIDVASNLGTYRDVLGVNKPPRGTDGQAMGANTYEVSEVYKALGISNVRLHDSQVDVSSIYSDDTVTTSGNTRSWACNNCGNIDSTSNYNFTVTNHATRTTTAAGAGVFLRLGESEGGANNVSNLSEFATAAINIYKHVIGNFSPTAGQSNADPTYIELFNEPDGGFWLGSKSDFYSLYNTTYDALKAYLSSIGKTSVLVGGPGFTTTFSSHTSISSNVASGFVTNATASRLDFLSSHFYGSCSNASVSEMATAIAAMRSYMNSNSLTSKPLVISEWNLGLTSGGCTETTYHAQRTQSFNASVMAIMQDTSLNIAKAHFYAGFGQMSLISVDSSAVGTVTVHPGAWAFRAHSQLSGGTQLTTESCDTSSNCKSGANMTSRGIQASAALVSSSLRLVLSNDTDTSETVQVNLKNWSASSAVSASLEAYPTAAVTTTATSSAGIYSVSAANAASLLSANVTATSVSASPSGTTLTLSVSVPARTVRLLKVN